MLSVFSNPQHRLLIVIAGPTAVGKTSLSIEIAKAFETEIVSCDSRQFYREMCIGTAVPSFKELTAVKHHFIGFLSVTDNYNVSYFENDAIACLNELFKKYSIVVMTGGSGLYIDAVCKGFDDLPDSDPEIRKNIQDIFEEGGLNALQEQLRHLDPKYFEIIDKNNPKRLFRAIEVCLISGKPYSLLRQGQIRERPFKVLKILLNRNRQELFARIAERTENMIGLGLAEEVKSLLKFRHTNALNTVGYKELFDFFDGKYTLEQAIENIKTNTRRYAKRQLTWFKKDNNYHYFEPEQLCDIISLIANTRF